MQTVIEFEIERQKIILQGYKQLNLFSDRYTILGVENTISVLQSMIRNEKEQCKTCYSKGREEQVKPVFEIRPAEEWFQDTYKSKDENTEVQSQL